MKVVAAQLHVHPTTCNGLVKSTEFPFFVAPSGRRTCVKMTSPVVCGDKEKCSRKPFVGSTVRKRGSWDGLSRVVVMSGASVGLALLLTAEKALALGPEGPLVEEFWDNVRRYALYALTVSTGAIYTIFEPIVELLKNPISALLICIILGGSIYIVFQVLSAMVGVSDFTYDYGY